MFSLDKNYVIEQDEVIHSLMKELEVKMSIISGLRKEISEQGPVQIKATATPPPATSNQDAIIVELKNEIKDLKGKIKNFENMKLDRTLDQPIEIDERLEDQLEDNLETLLVENLQDHKDELQEKIYKLEEELTKEREVIAELNSSIDNVTKSRDELQQKLDAVSQEFEAFKEAKEDEIDTFGTQLAAKDAEIESLNQKIEGMDAAYRQESSSESVSTEDKESLQNQINALESQLSEKNNLIAQLEATSTETPLPVAADIDYKLLKRFVPERLAEFIQNKSELTGISSKHKVTILFIELKQPLFTIDDEIETISQFWTEIVDIVHESGGYIDKISGNSILAVYGLDEGNDDEGNLMAQDMVTVNAVRAVRSALKIKEKVLTLNTEREEKGKEAFVIEAGIHSGEVYAGILGSESRSTFTVVGKTVILAATVARLNSNFQTFVLITKDTYDLANSTISAHPVRKIKIKDFDTEYILYNPEAIG